MITQATANPQRTTLGHLESAEQLGQPAGRAAGEGELPPSTANPRRTVLMDAPAQ
ncbi:hypothetical protein PJ985_12555 [Streptomyces sp. ACA25]|uniref:hypothetical protein n=1 Tax=Streptomyces sp. ACA25 TaxID=3022596 RepID=UPI0023078F87|nr:hypothetical protein [Streptomyces sp. ACA25]MDB1088396.1 hypothetical protein [Streptomyces sp. ACA25]